MMWRIFFAITVLAATTGLPRENKIIKDSIKDDTSDLLKKASDFLAITNKELAKQRNKAAISSWNYDTNITDANLALSLKGANDVSNYLKSVWKKVQKFPWRKLNDYETKRQFFFYNNIWEYSLPNEQFNEYMNITSKMSSIYSTAKICDKKNPKKCDLSLDPELTDIMAKNRDPENLLYTWLEWRKASGKKIKPFFPRYVELGNIASKLNNFTDKSAMWLSQYEAKDFQEQVENILKELNPLYLQIHAYVRRQLRKKYGNKIVSKDGPIPAHLLGNMWGETWENIADFTAPFPRKNLPDPTQALKSQGYDALKLVKLAEQCFVSMNMSAMPELFWKNSIFVKPTDREVVCHPQAWDFSDGKDFRFKLCIEVNANYFETVHHEMGHIQYYLQYKDLPINFKDGANPGFQEAVGDVMGLSVSTPTHLQKIKLLENYTADKEASINHLFLKSLEKVTLVPYAYIMDLWRYNIFRGTINKDQYNCEWWRLVEKYQGLEPPVDRSEEDLDQAAKYHIAADVEYLRYCISYIIQFQFHKTLCIEAGEYNPKDPKTKLLHECDITSSKKAGNLMKSMLKMGASKPWQDAMEVLTGQRKMSSSGILEYFKPLLDWLTVENKKTNEFIGWKKSTKRCLKAGAKV